MDEPRPMLRAVTFVVLASLASGGVGGGFAPLLVLAAGTDPESWRMPFFSILVLFMGVVVLIGPAFGQCYAMRWWFPDENTAFDDDSRFPPRLFVKEGNRLIRKFPGEVRRAPRSVLLLLLGGCFALPTGVGSLLAVSWLLMWVGLVPDGPS